MLRRCIILLALIPCFARADLLADLAREPEIINAKLSPTGQYIGVLREVNDKRTVVFFRFPDMQPLSIMEFPGRNEVGDFWWVNDGRAVASVVFEQDRYEEERGWGELYGMNVDGSEGEHLFGLRATADAKDQSRTRMKAKRAEYASAHILDPLWDDPKNIRIQITNWNLSGGYNAVTESARLNVYTGRVSDRQVSPAANAVLLTDDKGEVRFSFSISDAQESVIHLRNPRTGRWEEFSRTPYGDSGVTPLLALEDGRIVVLHEPGNAPRGIYLLDPKTQEKTRVFQHDIVDASPLFDFRDDLYGVRTDDGMPGFTAIDPEHPSSRLILALREVFKDRYVGVTSTTHDFSRSIVAVVDDDRTPEYYLHDASTNRLQLLFDAYTWIDDKALPTTRPISYRTRDGLTLHGYLSLPPGSEGRNVPLVIVPHGGPHGVRDTWGFGWETFIPASGYAMLQVNFRGSGGYGSDFEKSGFRKWSTEMQNDLTDGVKWAIDEGIADPARVCIFGWSYGGYAAVMSIAKEPDLYACSVAGAGVYDQEEQYRNADFADQTRWGRRYMDKVIGPARDDRRAASPMTYVDRIRTPLLLIHGEEDVRVPIEHSHALQQAFRKAGKIPPELIVLANEGHSPRNRKNIEEFTRATIRFFDSYIGKDSQLGKRD